MILIAPYPQLQSKFREEVDLPDGQGGTRKESQATATGRKDSQGNVINDARVTNFGNPIVEIEGVPNRRVAFSYDFSEEELRWIEEEFIPGFPGRPGDVFLTDEMPEDWRYPDNWPEEGES